MVRKKAVIFDMDGTLVDSIESLKYSMNIVLEAEGLPSHRKESYYDWVGGGLVDLVKSAVGIEDISKSELDRIYNNMLVVYNQNWGYCLNAFPGIYELLDELTTLNIDLAINTNKEQSITNKVVELLFKAYDFKVIVGERHEFPRKPNPTGTNNILEKLKRLPSDCIYVGDSVVDRDTASNSSIEFVGVNWGYGGLKDLFNNADLSNFIIRPEELIKYI